MSQSNQVAGLRYGEPARRAIATYDNYAEAEVAVDHLADRHFPVERIAIVGRDVKLVEQVTARLTYPTAGAHGAAAGALPGALIGWIFGLLDWVDPLTSSLLLAIYGLLFGAVVGELLNIGVYAMQRGRRDFATTRAMQSCRYDIPADAEVDDQAVRELEALGRVGRDTSRSHPGDDPDQR